MTAAQSPASGKAFDCGGDGCDECQVCEYLNFLEWAGSVSGGVPSVIDRKPELDAYILATYGVKP